MCIHFFGPLCIILVNVLVQSCNITFSRIFEKNVSKEIGLKLVICKGFISENFNQRGKIPNESDLLHMYI